MLEPCSPVEGLGSRRRGVEVCGCGVVAAETLIWLVLMFVCKYLIKFNIPNSAYFASLFLFLRSPVAFAAAPGDSPLLQYQGRRKVYKIGGGGGH